MKIQIRKLCTQIHIFDYRRFSIVNCIIHVELCDCVDDMLWLASNYMCNVCSCAGRQMDHIHVEAVS